MNADTKEILYRQINDAIDMLESRDIHGTLILLEGLRKEIQNNIYD